MWKVRGHTDQFVLSIVLPGVAKGKVVVATANGQVICFGYRRMTTVDSLSPKAGNFPLP